MRTIYISHFKITIIFFQTRNNNNNNNNKNRWMLRGTSMGKKIPILVFFRYQNYDLSLLLIVLSSKLFSFSYPVRRLCVFIFYCVTCSAFLWKNYILPNLLALCRPKRSALGNGIWAEVRICQLWAEL